MEVQELVKELNIDIKDALAFLGGDYEATSKLDQAKEKEVRNKFEKKDSVKKKKPIFVFHPENSSKFNVGKTKSRSGEGKKAGETGRPAKKVIKPSVPTTAESYRDYEKPQEAAKPAEKTVEETRETGAAVEKQPVQKQEETKGVSVQNKEVKEKKPAQETRGKFKFDNANNGRSGEKSSFGNRNNRDNGGKRPFEKNDGNRFSKDNRNGFQKPQNGGKARPAGKPDAGMGDSAAFTKSDLRGKKNNHNDKNRDDKFNRTGKNAENFKNLSKTMNKKAEVKKEEEVIKMIVLPEVITIKELAEKMKQKAADLIKKLFLQGKMMTVNTEISYEEAEEIALEYEILCEKEVKVDVIEELLKEEEEDEKLLKKRPPVVCVMGHVDHGKTSLLDAIRKTNVTAKEAGGITQHIGAYMVDCNGEKITFLDTPGHEAFTAMRLRGAQATDIAILVVAADDGVKPQTIEAINHAKAAGVELIVAVNKIDKPTANIERVKQELSEHEVIAEDWGGQVPFVPVSAKTGEGIEELLEMVLLVTEVQDLKANPDREMRGIVIEAKLDKGRGPVATVLVQKGTMKVGDFISAGSCYGRVRAMLNASGEKMKAAMPSMPAEILGLNGVPNAGEVCIGHKNEKEAREYAETFIAEHKKEMLSETKARLTMDSLFKEIQAGNIKELPIVIKADVQGSVEAVRQSLEKLSNEEVSVKVIHGGVGLINESDVSLASASNAIVIGFNVKTDTQAKQLAEAENVDLRLYKVIYQAIEDVEAAMKGMLAPVYEEKVLGHAEVRQTFKASGVGTIAGAYVLDGTFERGCMVRITRGDEQIFDGNLASLKRFKDDVKEVREGYECGLVFEKFNDIQEEDKIEAYKMIQVERS